MAIHHILHSTVFIAKIASPYFACRRLLHALAALGQCHCAHFDMHLLMQYCLIHPEKMEIGRSIVIVARALTALLLASGHTLFD